MALHRTPSAEVVEADPGEVFYQGDQELEQACVLSQEVGGLEIVDF